MGYKIDLHTHSTLSYDGGINAIEYRKALLSGKLDYIAITDHNEISFAQELRQELGSQIIVGEEIMCAGDVEVIGLYLTAKVAPFQSLQATYNAIKQQGGLVYIPHPLAMRRHGMGHPLVTQFAPYTDIIESYNGRSMVWVATKDFAEAMKVQNPGLVLAAGSDAHSRFGLGSAYSDIETKPTRENLKTLLMNAKQVNQLTNVLDLLAPSFNRLKKRL